MATTAELPADAQLFVATPSRIFTHSFTNVDRTLFECATPGIVNARPACDNSSLLAITDSQLVILHDAARGDNRKYALKSYEVRTAYCSLVL